MGRLASESLVTLQLGDDWSRRNRRLTDVSRGFSALLSLLQWLLRVGWFGLSLSKLVVGLSDCIQGGLEL